MNARVGNLSDQPDHEGVPGDCNAVGPYVPTRGQEIMQIPKRLSKEIRSSTYRLVQSRGLDHCQITSQTSDNILIIWLYTEMQN